MTRPRRKLTADEILDLCRRDREEELSLGAIGSGLRALGVTPPQAHDLIVDLLAIKRRGQRDADGIDFEIAACWRDDERRYRDQQRANEGRKTPLRWRTEEEPFLVDELRVIPELAVFAIDDALELEEAVA